jgi:uncharacterized RDD family membrane protein YckC
MRWRYLEGGREQGPVEEAELRTLIGEGRIHLETQVAPEDLNQWRPYREAIGAPVIPCHECGKTFTAEEMVRFGQKWVCAGCKPAYVQKLREGVQARPKLPYAGFWVRFAAVFLDGILLYAVNIGIGMAAGRTLAQCVGFEREPSMERYILFSAISLVVGGSYEVFLVGRYAATVGKFCCGIRVVDEDGQPISYLRATGRFLAKQVSGLILGIGYLMAAIDSQKRALHDQMCKTRVIHNK